MLNKRWDEEIHRWWGECESCGGGTTSRHGMRKFCSRCEKMIERQIEAWKAGEAWVLAPPSWWKDGVKWREKDFD